MIKVIKRNWKYSYMREDWFLISSFFFDMVDKFDEEKWIWKVFLNNKYNFINKNWILVSEWKKFDKNNHIFYNIPDNLYRISRLENLQSVIELWILSRELASRYLNFKNNSYDNIQNRREQFWIYDLHKYAPLFFSKYPAMLYSAKIKENIENQILLIIDWKILLEKWVIFSDVSLAYQDVSEKNIFSDLNKLENLDFNIFNKKWWEDNVLLRKKKWAEVLVRKRIDFNFIKEIIYFDKNKKNEIKNILYKKWFSHIPITYNNYEDYK